MMLRIAFTLVFTLTLMGCDGFDIDEAIDGDSPERTFTRTELAYHVIFSSKVLNDSGTSNRAGFIVVFDNTAELTQIKLRHDDEDDALVGNYTWTIVNNDLQVTYTNGAVCTSNKTSESAPQLTATAVCTVGSPRTDEIENTLNTLQTLSADSLEGRTIYINNDNQDQKIEFFTNGNYDITNLDTEGDEISTSRESGSYADDSDAVTDLNDVMILTNPSTQTETQLMLLEGSLSDGTLISLEYSTATEDDHILQEIRIYDIGENNRWNTGSQYDSISVDE